MAGPSLECVSVKARLFAVRRLVAVWESEQSLCFDRFRAVRASEFKWHSVFCRIGISVATINRTNCLLETVTFLVGFILTKWTNANHLNSSSGK